MLVMILIVATLDARVSSSPEPQAASGHAPVTMENTMNVHYLEIVTPDVDSTCAVLEQAHGVTFGEPVPTFGNARIAALASGGRMGVRAPMRETEEPVVRPYMLVKDLGAAVESARAAGCEIAIDAMELPGEGTIAIYIQGGIQHGFWQH